MSDWDETRPGEFQVDWWTVCYKREGEPNSFHLADARTLEEAMIQYDNDPLSTGIDITGVPFLELFVDDPQRRFLFTKDYLGDRVKNYEKTSDVLSSGS